MPERRPDLCVVGAGTAGETLAVAAAQFGASVLLVDDGIAAEAPPPAALRAVARQGGDFTVAMATLRRRVAALAPDHAGSRLAALGVTVLPGPARFVDPETLDCGGEPVRARRFVVARAPADGPAPPDGPTLTPATIWRLDHLPERLEVRGDGAQAVEFAQAFRRLGAAVTVVAPGRVLPQEDEELADVLRTRLRRDGVRLLEGVPPEAAPAPSHILFCDGEPSRVDALGLAAAGAIAIPGDVRTTNRRVCLLDPASGSADVPRVLRHALFRLPPGRAKATAAVVMTDPELARVGLGEAAARRRHGRVEILRWSVADLDRAVLERVDEGLGKVVLDRRGRVLGAAIAAPGAAELIAPWAMLMQAGLPVRAMADSATPVAAWSELNRRLATSWLSPRLFSRPAKLLLRIARYLG